MKSRSKSASLRSALVVGGLTLVALLGFFWLTGTLFPEDMNGLMMTPAQITGMALTYATTPAFLLAILIYSDSRTRSILDELVDSGRVTREAASAHGTREGGIGTAKNVGATLLGFFLGSGQVSWQPVFDSLGDPVMPVLLGIGIGNVVTWLAVVHVVLRRTLSSIALRRLGTAHTEVDLLRLDGLLPFGRIATLHLLIVAVTLGLSAFQSLDAEIRWDNYAAALAAGVPAGLVLGLLPMLGVRQSVRRAKRQTLARLDEAIEFADRELEPDALRYLGDLLHQRETIQHAREWPLDTTALSRIAIYFVIPPLAWVGGALVEIMIQAAL